MEKIFKVLLVMLIFVPLLIAMEIGFRIEYKKIKSWKIWLYKFGWMLYGMFIGYCV